MLPVINNYKDLMKLNKALAQMSLNKVTIQSVYYTKNIIKVDYKELNIDRFLYDYVTKQSFVLEGKVERLKQYDFTRLNCLVHPREFREQIESYINNLTMMGGKEFTLWDFKIKIEPNEVVLKEYTKVRAKEVFIPYFITRIGAQAFYNYYQKLERVIIQEGSQLRTIEKGAFGWCSHLQEINLPEGLEKIEGDAFMECSLKEIIIPSTTKVIGDRAFYDVKTLITLIIKEDSQLREIGAHAFNETSIHKLYLPQFLEKIGVYAFQSCNNLKEVVIPNNVKEVGIGAFSLCHNIENLIVGEGVKKIPNFFIQDSHKLKNIKILGDIESIGDGAFYRTSIEEVIIPKSSPIALEGGSRRLLGVNVIKG